MQARFLAILPLHHPLPRPKKTESWQDRIIYEEQVQRESLWRGVPVTAAERQVLLDDFCAAAIWQPIYFRWRPNLPDADDDHILELAIAGGVEHLVTHNTRDFGRGELKFASPRIVTPAQHLKLVK